MIDENLSLMRAHCNSIARYRKLLKTSLTDLERKFVERRIAEEQSALEKIAASTFPLAFRLPASPATMGNSQCWTSNRNADNHDAIEQTS